MEATKTKTESVSKFREIESSGLFMSEQNADYSRSLQVLADNNLRMLTYQEALVHYKELINELSGTWFWLAGNCSKPNGLYTFDDKGELIDFTGKTKVEKTVIFSPGSQPLTLLVDFEGDCGRSFHIAALMKPHIPARVVVGVRKTQEELLRN